MNGDKWLNDVIRNCLLGAIAGALFAIAAKSDGAEVTGGWVVGELPATNEHDAGVFVSTFEATDTDHWVIQGYYTEAGLVRNYQGGCIPRVTDAQQPSCFAMWADQSEFWSFPLGNHPLPDSAMKGRTATYESGVRSPMVGPKGDKGDKGDPGRDGRDGADGADGRDGSDGRDGADGQDGSDGSTTIITPPDPPAPVVDPPAACAAARNALWDYADESWVWCDQASGWRAQFDAYGCEIYQRGDLACATYDFGGFGGTLRIEGRTAFSRNDRDCHAPTVATNAQDICKVGSGWVVSTPAYLGQIGSWGSGLTLTEELQRKGLVEWACDATRPECTSISLASFGGKVSNPAVWDGSRLRVASASYSNGVLTAEATGCAPVMVADANILDHLYVREGGDFTSAYLVLDFTGGSCSGAVSLLFDAGG